MKHTPGPWNIAYKDRDGFIIKTPDEYNVCTVRDVNLFNCNEANAKLIASAPELLEACQEMVKHLIETDFDVCGTPDELMNKWQVAIKKATT